MRPGALPIALREPPGVRSAQEESMARCPECESDLELDGYDLDVDETLHCPECSVELKVVSGDPLTVAPVGEEEG